LLVRIRELNQPNAMTNLPESRPNQARWMIALPRGGHPSMRFLLLLACLLFWACPADAATLIATGAVWKYLATGSEPSPSWTSRVFDDVAWPEGPAQLGYGDGDEATTVPFGPDPEAKYITTYFRRSFSVPNPAEFDQLTLRVLRDDGVVIYLNGVEAFRQNLPSGFVHYDTLASTNVFGESERTYYPATFPVGDLLESNNVVAVELHQASPQNVDLSLDLELVATNATQRTGGPYLQSGLTNSAVVRWRTAIPNDSRVRCGTSRDALGQVFSDPAPVTEHIVSLTGLQPDTRYYYTVGSADAHVSSDDFSFQTAPMRAKPTRIWAIGDPNMGGPNLLQVRDAYRAFTGERTTDVWLTLGDNATESQLFGMFPVLLCRTFYWPTLGNHDWPPTAYMDMFSLPANGEAGVASGTERYYSFDYGNIHFVSLDSTGDRSSGGPMAAWLREDLAATTRDWIIAFWHYPPYSTGSHNSDVEGELIEMRQNIVPILDAHGVDLVLCGHSHAYERSYLLSGYYGLSNALEPAMLIDHGDGREAGTGAYLKPLTGPRANLGTVYVVAGTASQVRGGTLDHPAMCVSLNRLGSLVIDIDGLRLDSRFLRETGEIDDSFTIIKGAPAETLRFVTFRIQGGQVEMRWKSVPGATYRVEKTFGLGDSAWFSASANIIASGATTSWSEPLTTGMKECFYRLRLVD
jgi:hypothetical protein